MLDSVKGEKSEVGLKISFFLPGLPRIIGKAEGSGETEFYKTLRNGCFVC